LTKNELLRFNELKIYTIRFFELLFIENENEAKWQVKDIKEWVQNREIIY
jgi:hypothetical protein